MFCQEPSHRLLQGFSGIVIGIVAIGLPLWVGYILVKAAREYQRESAIPNKLIAQRMVAEMGGDAHRDDTNRLDALCNISASCCVIIRGMLAVPLGGAHRAYAMPGAGNRAQRARKGAADAIRGTWWGKGGRIVRYG